MSVRQYVGGVCCALRWGEACDDDLITSEALHSTSPHTPPNFTPGRHQSKILQFRPYFRFPSHPATKHQYHQNHLPHPLRMQLLFKITPIVFPFAPALESRLFRPPACACGTHHFFIIFACHCHKSLRCDGSVRLEPQNRPLRINRESGSCRCRRASARHADEKQLVVAAAASATPVHLAVEPVRR